MAFERVVNAEVRLTRLAAEAEAVLPPADVASVHTTVLSALGMARESAVRRRQAVIFGHAQADREASAAAAGALLLAERARQDLVAALFPPKPEE
jgi:hypothetical protein